MPLNTTKWGIQYPVSSDSLTQAPQVIKNLADRVDLLLAERGVVQITVPSANGTATVQVNFGRTYPNLTPKVFMQMSGAPSGFTWITPYPSSLTETGFLANCRAAVAGQYTIQWAALL